MLKRNITYENFNGDTVTGVFWFHLSQPELVKMQVSKEEGFQEFLLKIIKTEDKGQLVDLFDKIILGAYGVKSADGEHFEKSDELREKFASSAAYDALFMELVSSTEAMSAFVNGVVPQKMIDEINNALISDAVGSLSPEEMLKRAQAGTLSPPVPPVI